MKSQTPDDSKRVHLTPEALANRINKSTITLQRWRSQGKGPQYIKTGHRSVVYDEKDVEEWENSRKPKTNN